MTKEEIQLIKFHLTLLRQVSEHFSWRLESLTENGEGKFKKDLEDFFDRIISIPQKEVMTMLLYMKTPEAKEEYSKYTLLANDKCIKVLNGE